MTFALDRDLLVYEPTLFRDALFASQIRHQSADAAISGTTLTSASADFAALGVDAGDVAVVDGAPLEVVSRLSSTQLQVSRLREQTSDAAIAPSPASGASLTVATFAPQRKIVHDMLLRAIGVEPTDPAASPGEADITNPQAFLRAEALGALHLIFAAAAPMVGPEAPLAEKARIYAERFARARRLLVAGIDLDGDGLPDAVRRANVLQLTRI